MIKASQVARQMIDFQKFSFLSCYDAATAMQNQATSTMDLMLKQAGWIPSEGRQAISTWMDTCQQERDRLKAYVEKSFANLGMYFAEKPAAAPAKTKKPSALKAKKAIAAEPKKAAPLEAKKAAPVETKKVAPLEAKKAVPVEARKVTPVEAKKTAPVEARKVAPLEAKKAAPAETKKVTSVEAKKAAPAETKVAPAEPRTDTSAATKKQNR